MPVFHLTLPSGERCIPFAHESSVRESIPTANELIDSSPVWMLPGIHLAYQLVPLQKTRISAEIPSLMTTWRSPGKDDDHRVGVPTPAAPAMSE